MVATFLYFAFKNKKNKNIGKTLEIPFFVSGLLCIGMFYLGLQTSLASRVGYEQLSHEKITHGIEDIYKISSIESSTLLTCAEHSAKTGVNPATWHSSSGQQVLGKIDAQRYGDKCLYRLIDNQGNPLPLQS